MEKVKKINSLPKSDFNLPTNFKKNRKKRSEFQELLDAQLTEIEEDLDTYSLQLPKHGYFWDDGYRDVRLVNDMGHFFYD